MLFKDLEFVKCVEYNPYSERANNLGMVYFWRAEYNGRQIAYGDTKKECVDNARLKTMRINRGK